MSCTWREIVPKVQNMSENPRKGWLWLCKRSPSFFLLRFQGQNLSGYDTFLSNSTDFGFSKMRFLSGISIIPQHPQKTIETSHFPWEKSGKVQWCLRILENQQKVQNVHYFVSSKVYQEFWKFNRWNSFKLRVDFFRAPHKQSKWHLRIFCFWMTKCFKLQSWDLICFEGTWFKLWSTQKLILQLNIIHRCLIGFQFASVVQNDQVNFRWFAFEKWNLLMQKINIFQNFRNFWFWNFYFRWLYIMKKMSNFDGWPGVE